MSRKERHDDDDDEMIDGQAGIDIQYPVPYRMIIR